MRPGAIVSAEKSAAVPRAESGVAAVLASPYTCLLYTSKAGELLHSGKNLTIQEVAAQVGYTSILTFNRKFKAC